MKTKIITFLLLLHLVVVVKTELCTCPGYIVYYATDSTIYACLREALQAKLTSTPTYIQQLQNLFYFSNDVQSFLMNTNMTVNVSCESTEVGQLCNSSISYLLVALWCCIIVWLLGLLQSLDLLLLGTCSGLVTAHHLIPLHLNCVVQSWNCIIYHSVLCN